MRLAPSFFLGWLTEFAIMLLTPVGDKARGLGDLEYFVVITLLILLFTLVYSMISLWLAAAVEHGIRESRKEKKA